MMSMKYTLLATLLLLGAASARAEDLQTYNLTLKGHKFAPAELHIPSGRPFFIVVTNGDATADEFEMGSPPLEKMIQPGAEGRMRVRPLAPGRFEFFDDFHPEARGALVAE
jgi:hypothetical protein